MSLSLTDELSKFEQDQVTIEYRDRKDNNRKKQMTISADELFAVFCYMFYLLGLLKFVITVYSVIGSGV
jgi:hypothetical protein